MEAERGIAGREPLVLAIPNAHIDPVWIWGWREGMREVVATFRAAVERLESDPGLGFAASSAAYYEWVERMDPDLFARIQRQVAEDRWELVGGEWVEPDCTVPSGESVCRQLLYAQRYFQRAFGRTATVAYNVDSFGHAGSLPQLLAKGGLRAYVMMRPQEHEKHLPGCLFSWRGVDGTVLPTFRIVGGYQTGVHGGQDAEEAEAAVIRSRAAELLERSEREHTPMMLFVGVGDHGGGLTSAAIRAVEELRDEQKGLVDFGSVRAFFEVAQDARLPEVAGDLHMHAVGCYSVVSWIKAENARCEARLVAAESLASACRLVTGRDLDAQARLGNAWKKVLFNQFHDSLGGTCTEEVCEELAQFYGFARTVADELEAEATQLLAAQADTFVDGSERVERSRSLDPYSAHFPVPLVVFNPLSRPVRAPLVFPHPAGTVSSGGSQVPSQLIGSREGTRYENHTLVVADLPAAGFRVFWLDPPAGTESTVGEEAPGVSTSAGGVVNEDLTVRIDPDRGGIQEVTARGSGRHWLRPEGIHPVVVADPSDTWSHGVIGYGSEERSPALRDVRVVEDGPLRATVRLGYAWNRSSITLDVSVYQGLDVVDLRVRADWRERHEVLKLVVPLNLDPAQVIAGLPYGAVARDVPGQEAVLNGWLSVTEPGDAGVVCSTDAGCAYDVESGRLRLTVLRSPRYSDHYRPWMTEDPIDFPATDQGWHEVAYRLRFYEQGVPPWAGAYQAEEQRTSFPMVPETWHPGRLGQAHSILNCGPINVSVTAMKRGEDAAGWVLRVVETGGETADASVELKPRGRSWQGRMGPYEVKTLLIPDDEDAPVGEVLISELAPAELRDR